MEAESVRRMVFAQPFAPFSIRLADGRKLPVVHRDFVMLAPNGRSIIVYQPDSSFNIVDVLLITDLESRHQPEPLPSSMPGKRPCPRGCNRPSMPTPSNPPSRSPIELLDGQPVRKMS